MFASAYNTLLCRLVLRLFMCLSVQHDSRWRHVSFWRDMHMLHVGNTSCLKMWFFFFLNYNFGSSLGIFHIKIRGFV